METCAPVTNEKLSKLGVLRQLYATIAVNIGIFGLGSVVGWTSSGLSSLDKDFNLSSADKSWISAIINLGGLISCLTAGHVVDKLGRKLSSILLNIPFLLGWGLLIFAKNVAMLYASRFILGYAASFYGVVGPILVGEIASPQIRGVLSNMYGVFLTSGMLFSYTVGFWVEWRTLSIACAAAPLICLAMLPFIPESPRHCLHTGHRDKAVASLCWYRGTELAGEVQDEINFICQEAPKNHEALNRTSIFSRQSLLPLAICISLVLVEQLSGFAAIVAYTADIFESVGHEGNSNLITILFGVAQLLATIISCFLVDKVGRRPLLLVGELCMTMSLGFLGTYYFFAETGVTLISKWAPVACLIIYIVAFCIGIGPISTTYMGEVLPQNIRGIGSAICTAVLRLSAFAISMSFNLVKESLGGHWLFWFFTGVCVAAILVIVFLVPETKGKSFEEIAALFKSTKFESNKHEPTTSHWSATQQGRELRWFLPMRKRRLSRMNINYHPIGFPQNILLPKVTQEGMVFDLFVMLTNANDEDSINVNPAPS